MRNIANIQQTIIVIIILLLTKLAVFADDLEAGFRNPPETIGAWHQVF